MRRIADARWRLVLMFLLLGFAARGETLRLRADTWMPYNGEPTAALPGYAIEIVRTIFTRHDITLDYQNMAWGDALKAAQTGEIEAVVGANRDEAAGLAVPQECIGTPRVGLFVRKDSTWRYANITSLRAIRLGTIVDYKYWPAFDEYVAKQTAPQVTQFSGDHPLESAIAQLKDGTLDVVAETSSVFGWAAKNAGHAAGDFRMVYLHEGDPVFVAFTTRDGVGERYAALFDAGLRELRRSGELTKILTRYGQKDWE